MLAKKYRLLSTTKFQHAKLYQTPYFSLRYQEGKIKQSAFGFIVTKQVDKRAVVRNQLKRRFRACIEEHIHTINEGVDLLFFIKKDATTLTKQELCSNILELLQKEQLLKK